MLGRKKPEPVPDIAISDCRHWRYRGIPAFWCGADGSRYSAANEYVEIEELLHLVRTYTLAAMQYLSKPHKTARKKQTALKPSAPFQPISPKIRFIPPVYAAYIKGAADSFKSADLSKAISELLDTLYIRLTQSGILAGATAIATMEQNDTGSKRQVMITAAYPVDRDVVSGKGFEVMEFPAIQSAAVTVHRGSKSTTSSWNGLRRFAAAQGCKDTGVYREHYIVSPPTHRNNGRPNCSFP